MYSCIFHTLVQRQIIYYVSVCLCVCLCRTVSFEEKRNGSVWIYLHILFANSCQWFCLFSMLYIIWFQIYTPHLFPITVGTLMLTMSIIACIDKHFINYLSLIGLLVGTRNNFNAPQRDLYEQIPANLRSTSDSIIEPKNIALPSATVLYLQRRKRRKKSKIMYNRWFSKKQDVKFAYKMSCCSGI